MDILAPVSVIVAAVGVGLMAIPGVRSGVETAYQMARERIGGDSSAAPSQTRSQTRSQTHTQNAPAPPSPQKQQVAAPPTRNANANANAARNKGPQNAAPRPQLQIARPPPFKPFQQQQQ